VQKVLGDFIHALRHAGLPVSPAETLDALQAARLVGIQDKQVLKSALTLTLAKNSEHQASLARLFEEFFSTVSPPSERTDNDEEPIDSSTTDTTEPHTAENNENLDTNTIEDSDLESLSPLAQQLLSNDQNALQMAISAAGDQAGASQMQLFTQKSVVSFRIMQALGDGPLNKELSALETENKSPELVNALRTQQQNLRQQVKDYVEQQYLLFSSEKGNQLREESLQKVKLSNIDHSHYQHMTKLVQKAAKQLASMHSRRRRVTKRGLLDVKKTIAANAAYDGFLFHTKWKSTRIDRPKVMVICDVSGSVSRVARFLLLFLYSLQDVLPRVRSFVFTSDLNEVTDNFEKQSLDEAMSEIMNKWANLPTDYGKALQDFKESALKDIDNKTTVIMLGDARNNNGDGNTKVWQEVYNRSQRVLWLNPEGKYNWDSGDSIMGEYTPYCSRVEHCSSLRDLTRILGSLLKHS
jgi:uncharacterized protein with von Willebrand factor type A (vWA) domain